MGGTREGSRVKRGGGEQSRSGVPNRPLPNRRARPRKFGIPNISTPRVTVVRKTSLGSQVRQRIRPAIAMLLEAFHCAQSLGQGTWDFAVEIERLGAAGVSNTDLRYLVCVGYAEHATEITRPRSPTRVFQRIHNLGLTDRTCFVLTELGESFALNAGISSRISSPSTLSSRSRDGRREPRDKLPIPKWLPERRELRVGNLIVKQFKLPARNQETILAAFEEEGWPIRIDDPLPPHGEQEPKRRLQHAIRKLNRHQKHPLVQFRSDGTGRGIRWELKGEPPPS